MKRITWNQLNDELRTCTIETATALAKRGKKESWPVSYMLRIQQRINRLNSTQAIKSLLAAAK
jgi:hypothetical protein